MNSAEEKLWSYIDGTCTATERAEIAAMIAANEEFRLQYEELLALNAEFASIELDEPPMAFTYKVMEQIRTEEARVPLRTIIDKRYIYGVAGFFGITIVAILIFAVSSMDWTSNTNTLTFASPVKISMPNVSSAFKQVWMQCFLFFDTVLALFLADSYFRKKSSVRQGEAN